MPILRRVIEDMLSRDDIAGVRVYKDCDSRAHCLKKVGTLLVLRDVTERKCTGPPVIQPGSRRGRSRRRLRARVLCTFCRLAILSDQGMPEPQPNPPNNSFILSTQLT